MPTDELERMRARMDALNLRIRDLLQERARLALEIARWKRAHGIAVADPARESQMLVRVRENAPAGFDGDTLGAVFEAVFRETRAWLAREIGA